MNISLRFLPTALVCAVLQIGCGSEKGSALIELTGRVEYDGRPLPLGMIIFEPDPAAGNKGPQGYAQIKNGIYDTRNNGKGTVSGDIIIKITGGDGVNPEPFTPFGKNLFQEQISKAKIDPTAKTHDVKIPKQ